MVFYYVYLALAYLAIGNEKLRIINKKIIFSLVPNLYVSENERVKLIPNVHFYTLEKNIGRSKIRNLLTEKATFEWLLCSV